MAFKNIFILIHQLQSLKKQNTKQVLKKENKLGFSVQYRFQNFSIWNSAYHFLAPFDTAMVLNL